MNKIVCFFICCKTKLIKISISRDKFFEMKLIFLGKSRGDHPVKKSKIFCHPSRGGELKRFVIRYFILLTKFVVQQFPSIGGVDSTNGRRRGG